MTDPDFDANRVLTRACDDGDRPYDYSIDTVLRRGRRRVLVRNTTGAAASTVAVGAIAVGAAQLTGSGRTGSDTAPAASSSTSSSVAPPWTPVPYPSSPSSAWSSAWHPPVVTQRVVPLVPVATMSDRKIIQRCKVFDEEFLRVSSNKAGGGTDPLDDWSVVIKEAPQRHRVQAILLSPDGKRYAYCGFSTEGVELGYDYSRQSVAVEVRDYEVFTGGMGAAAAPVPTNVARMTFQISNVVHEARVKDGFVLWKRPDISMDEPVWANFYDASGKRVARFNTSPPPRGTVTVR